MTTQQLELWLEIQQFEIDDPLAEIPFSKRLAAAQSWNADFTQLAIDEYKKFMFLAATVDFSVTPSLILDEVWHEHIVFTRNYWIDFCQNTLGKEIHHTPSGGSLAEEAKYRAAFLKTIEAYKSAFDQDPPREIWHEDPKEIKRYEEERKTRTTANIFAWVIALWGSILFSSFLSFFILLVGGLTLCSFMFPDSRATNHGDSSCGAGCGGGGCGGGGCGGCGGG